MRVCLAGDCRSKVRNGRSLIALRCLLLMLVSIEVGWVIVEVLTGCHFSIIGQKLKAQINRKKRHKCAVHMPMKRQCLQQFSEVKQRQ